MMRGQTEAYPTYRIIRSTLTCRKARRTMAAPHPNPPGNALVIDDLAFMQAILQYHNILGALDWQTGKKFWDNDNNFTSYLSDTPNNDHLLNCAVREYNKHLVEWNKQKLHEGYSVAEIRKFAGVKMSIEARDIRALFKFIPDMKITTSGYAVKMTAFVFMINLCNL
ncbi:hypothetical protein HYALB_00013984 [Hymenoscyphus albidus]|uniref:Uncharacterized protein n=1 Tax=Hymenoscyphus albidus TaxID=595503 RepID=A0A9N9M0F4_9HELO|nr:hypothetical protein HYALB_00013984 [Hymenoscyphus albidus]